MGKTSSAVKQRWNEKTYTRLSVYLRKEEDAKYIEFIKNRREKGENLADIIKEALDCLMDEEKQS